MKRILILTAALVSLTATQAWAAGLCCGNKCSCITPPCPSCPDCSCPCDKCRMPAIYGSEHTQKLIDTLCNGDCCERIHAAKKLGHPMHADFCKCPEVLNALIKAMQCDTCWEVRREAALALAHQKARVPQAVVALYIASKLDHHYMVRDGAITALDIMLVCRRECFKDDFAAADKLIVKIRKDYDPTNCKCVPMLADFCAQCGSGAPVVASGPAPVLVTPMPKGESIPAPKEEAKEPKLDK